MKKAGLLIVVIFLFTCSRKDIPLSLGKDIGSDAGNKEKYAPFVTDAFDFSGNHVFEDLDNDPSNGYQDVIRVVFSERMNSNTINSTNIKVHRVVNGQIQGAIPGTINYYDDLNMAEFVPSDGFENADSVNYMIFVSSEVTDIHGNKLDQNQNGTSEGSPFDDFNDPAFRCPASNNTQPDFTPPFLMGYSPAYGSNDVSTTPDISVSIFGTDVDTSTIESGDIELKEYETGLSTSCNLDSVVITGVGATAWFSPQNSLDYGKVYQLTIKNTIQDSAGNYTDIDGNGTLEMDEDTVIHFATQLSSGDPVEFPEVASADLDPDLKLIHVRFTKEMNTSDFTFTNIKAFKQRNPYPADFISGIIRADSDNKGFTYSLTEWDGTYPVYIFISYAVKDADGFKLDGNEDGVGGIREKDNYWHAF